MRHLNTLIIGGGQAGLAMSRCLSREGIDHLVLERGRVAERWHSERWDSLRLLTPRWMSRLPDHVYRGDDPHGYMTRTEVIELLEQYARSTEAPVLTGVRVTAVERHGRGYRVRSPQGMWTCDNVVLATGYCDRASTPACANRLHPRITQILPTSYRNPSQLPEGGVLVVGASATGIQLAAEIAASGRHVTLAAGRHIRLPRCYRGRDILDWMDAAGILSEPGHAVRDLAASRRQPSLQLIGSDPCRSIDLGVLQASGVRIAGHLRAVESRAVAFTDDLPQLMAHAEAKMHRQLDAIDRHVTRCGLDAAGSTTDRPDPITLPEGPRMLNLEHENIRTVLWATGFRRDYSWLKIPVLNARGELIHHGGITPSKGLYALGLNFMRRRNSSFLDGVGADAHELSLHIAQRNQTLNQTQICLQSL